MKAKSHFSCQECGASQAKWMGKCPNCSAWNSFVEERLQSSKEEVYSSFCRDEDKRLQAWETLGDLEDKDESDLNGLSANNDKLRLKSGIGELDRVLGGGLTPDSFVLVGGDPGIGKSTLLMQAAQGFCCQNPELKILYVSGEESISQVRARAKRIGTTEKYRLFFASETVIEKVFLILKELKPNLLFVDSLQTFSTETIESGPGSVSQVREITQRLMKLAKTAHISVWIVGHVTKDGNIAGPKTVEHMVDTVLYFESEAAQTYRLLRTVKNRYGSSRELGVFEMEGEGLKEVKNPSSLFLNERKHPAMGTAVGSTFEGSRPLLVELQALVSPSGLAMPRRTSVGLDHARVSLIAAVLEKHLKLNLAQSDLFFNVAGGLRLGEPASDLAAAAAIWSSHEETALPMDWVFAGEVGLTGEVRRVSNLDVRVEEARKLGFKAALIPGHQLDTCKNKVPGMELVGLQHIGELSKLFSSRR